MVDNNDNYLFKLFVLGNNYDGCLLTGDTNDILEFQESKFFKNFDFNYSTVNNLQICLGLKNVALINSICLINFMYGKLIFMGKVIK